MDVFNTKSKNTLNGRNNVKVVDPIDPSGDGCTSYSNTVGPLLQTTWGQMDGYNDNFPALSCGPGGHAFTGCWTTAIAQIFRYKQYPTSWNFSIMPDRIDISNSSSSGANEVRSMLKYIFDNTVDYPTDVNCNGTLTLNSNGINFLSNYFSYANRLNYSYTNRYLLAMSELNNGHPVIFTGWNSSQTTAHAWVCDGYYENYICFEESGPIGMHYLYFHMNWGNDTAHDGWFGFNNFIKAGEFNYNYDVDIYVGLHN